MLKSIAHFFYQLKGTEPKGPFAFLGGEYIKSKGFLYKKNTVQGTQKCLENFQSIVHNLPEKACHILVYIHGYLAENPWFASLSGYTLQQEIFEDHRHDVNVVLSLQWDSGFQYETNRTLAFQKGIVYGKYLSELIATLHKKNKEVKISFLLHSMGSIVFEGMVTQFPDIIKSAKIHQVFLCASDLSTDIFQNGLITLPSLCKNVHVIYHNHDKTLRIANAFMDFRRLGIYGIENSEIPKNVHTLDVTEMANDDSALGSRFSHHRYFYGSKNVRDYINRHLGTK